MKYIIMCKLKSPFGFNPWRSTGEQFDDFATAYSQMNMYNKDESDRFIYQVASLSESK